MAKVTVKKEQNFTIISNDIFKDTRLSFKAKGLLTTMLSCPPNWNYTIEGLSKISKDGKASIRSALAELEEFGYLERKQLRDEKGSFTDLEYIVYEKSTTENPISENPTTDNPISENSTQLSTNVSNIDIFSTDELNTNGLSTDTEKDKTLTNVNAKVQTSLSERKQIPKSAKQKYLDMKSNEIDMLNRAYNICYENYDEPTADEIYNTIEHYFAKYTEKTGKIHPILTDNTLRDIIDRMTNFSDTEYEHFGNVIGQPGVFIKIIDSYFGGDYGSLKGYETNWHLPHFMSDGVLNRLTQRLWEIGEVI